MNPEKLKKLQAQAELVRIGGKGTPRRKKKIVHQTAATDDKKLQSTLKKLAVNNIPGIEEVNLIKNDGSVIHFNNPKTQASLASNVFAITGHGEQKQIAELLPGILTQLGSEGLSHLKRLANNVVGSKILSSVQEEGKEEDIPDLVENFENVANSEASPATQDAQDKKAEEIAAMIASSTLEEAAKKAGEEKPAPQAAAAAPEDKKDTKKETTPKKSNEKGAKKQQQSKDKKA